MERQGSLADRKWEQWPSIPMLRGGERACNERDEDALSFYHRVATQKKKKTESGTRLKAAIPEDLQPLEGKRAISYQVTLAHSNPYLVSSNYYVLCIDFQKQRAWGEWEEAAEKSQSEAQA